ncbi:hypothetical protein O1611_g10505 [Lasiodiplodia mahajangana]|uniref:Uncharacterized protein n=1 Tax=Lasiodiplodia mahajangana TaxID=1108764 RepID=A0ACC2IXR3_9PEZI|nr:hypothetical protein O1611_g10505 [Lasiodiplodia mahajangana]
MTSHQTRHGSLELGEQRPSLERPRFNSQVTSHRLEEGSKFVAFPMSGNIRKGRKSVFREIGLDDDWKEVEHSVARQSFEEKEVNETARKPSIPNPPAEEREDSVGREPTPGRSRRLLKLITENRPKIKSAATAPPSSVAGMHRFTLIALMIAVLLPAISYNNGRHIVEVNGADAGVIPKPMFGPVLEDRANSPTSVCKRWAGQSKHYGTHEM